MIKNRPLAAKETQGNLNTYQPAEPQPHQKTMESCIRNNNTQNFRKPYWFVRNCWKAARLLEKVLDQCY